ncbi:MAG: hypothetical protein P1U91_06845 [Pseudophaeobacter sp. bin_em_oilr2.035]|uniref:Uncharacterized protein n=1 Tax=Phaeobacter gallaeciensis TaxID=60890 RepID=A0ABD4XAG6_9RHOB|nr:hypothetical protein [Phaeobacter gallaeciensis]MDF1771658.1 hypothetical protein [Pseudophaeobacter sp. bin_em_oilr2.035]MDE4145274.1 hypothetical protein [Phaeobacter gallaeciensis]MDE4157945.1 hypothetical protein [Phaeobacter gallaeciensis]MDE4162124.1 hypothetical protein [Phaeobacter gallaeciensis]MDE4166350.1 hypothetical protein [Phaeobacter gallaeciensis]
MPQIETEEQLKEWLDTQDWQVCFAIGVRAAIRSLPELMHQVDAHRENSSAQIALLSSFRAAITNAELSTLPPREAEKKYALDEDSELGRLIRADETALAVLESVLDSLFPAASFLDATLAQRPDWGGHVPTYLFQQPLWHGTTGIVEFLDMWQSFEREFKSHSPWCFWCHWYQGFLEGKPLDWELQRRVAQIDDDIWDAGPEAVAEEIERIKAANMAEKLPLAETIEVNPETSKFRAVPIPVENAPLMSALLTQIADATEDALQGHNGLTERSGDIRRLNRVITRYGNDPQQAELTLTSVAKSLSRQIHDSRELPDNEDNLALLDAVKDGVRGIRANHPEVAANREQLAQQALGELSAEDKQVLEQAQPLLTAISEGAMAEDFAEDIPELINDAARPLPTGAPALPGADATTRIFSRVSKMALLVDHAKKLAKTGAQTFDSDLVKTIRLAGLTVTTIGGVGAILFNLVQIGLRILGVL